jgi:hypothetical protein
VLWLDAGQITGLSAGSPVPSWPDASPLSRSATQQQVTFQPLYQPNLLNGRPVVRFDGIDDHLTVAASVVSGATARTVFVVARPDTVENSGFIDLGNGNSTGGAFMLSPEFAVRASGGNRFWQPGALTSQAGLLTVRLNGPSTSNLTAWRNGALMPVSATAALTLNTTGNTTIGDFTSTAPGLHSYDGDLAEVIVYNRALTDSERQSVERYLIEKYALGARAIAGLQLWLDAAQIANAADGSTLAQWNDSSGNGRTATQATVGMRPQYQAGGLNGRPAVAFDGTDDHLGLPAAIVSGAQARTVFVAMRPDIIGNRGAIDLGNGTTPTNAFLLTPEIGVRVAGGNRLWPGATASVATVVAVPVQLNGAMTADLSAWRDGTQLTPSSTVNVAVNTNGNGTVGSYTAIPTSFGFAGTIAEIAVYDRAVSPAERQAVETYLRAKYGTP